MSLDHADRFIVLFCAGAGMALAGGVNMLTARLGTAWRALLTGVGCGIGLAGVAALTGNPEMTGATALVMTLGVVPVLLVGSTSLVALARRTADLVSRPGVRWGLLAVAGIVTTAASAAWFEYADSANMDADMRALGLEFTKPPLTEPAPEVARTDRGSAIPGKRPSALRAEADVNDVEQRYLQSTPFRDQMMRQRKADDESNCHGWVFTGGRYWLDPGSVELILKENGYVDVTAPRPGDLAIYRSNGTISHTGVVRYVSDGAPVLVEGKWGPLGVYVHPADRCPYGTVTFYRSSRPGHLLAGLNGTSLAER